MRTALALVVAAAFFLPARAADACRCFGVNGRSPTNGATDVPTNLAEIVITAFTNQGPVTLESATASIPVGPSGAPMHSFEVQRFPVLGALEPATEYALKVNGVTSVTFTTGAGPDVTSPAAITIDRFRLAAPPSTATPITIRAIPMRSASTPRCPASPTR